MGCVTARPSRCLAESIPTPMLAPICPPPFSSPFLAPPNQGPIASSCALDRNLQLKCLVHQGWQQAVRRSQAIDGLPFQGDRVSATIQAQFAGTKAANQKGSPPLYMSPSLQLGALSQPCCLTGARLDDKVLSPSRIVSGFSRRNGTPRDRPWTGRRSVIPVDTSLCKMIGCLFPRPQRQLHALVGEQGLWLIGADPDQVAATESTGPHRSSLETCWEQVLTEKTPSLESYKPGYNMHKHLGRAPNQVKRRHLQ